MVAQEMDLHLNFGFRRVRNLPSDDPTDVALSDLGKCYCAEPIASRTAGSRYRNRQLAGTLVLELGW